MPNPIRIPLGEFEGFEGEWVEIHPRRAFGTRNAVSDSLGQGMAANNRTRMSLYVASWSLPGSPTNETVIDELDEEIAVFILDQAEEHYGRSRRTPAERKSDEGAASEGVGAAGNLADDGQPRRITAA
jgi:hypothetical protein